MQPLAVAGVLVQGIVRNPLASPDILGINHAASLPSVGALLLMPSLSVMVLPLLAFAGGMAGLILLKMLAKTHQPMKLALTGVALSACWASLTDYLMLLHPQDVNSALLWLTGSLWGRDWHFVKIAVPLLILFLPLSLRFCRDLDLLLALGDARAATLGVSVQRTRFQGLMLAVAMTATGVAVCGPDKFYWSRRAAHGAQDRRRASPLADARFGPDGRGVAGHCRSAGTIDAISAAGASGRRADRHYRRTVVCLAAGANGDSRTENLTVSYGAQPCWMDFLALPASEKSRPCSALTVAGNRRC